MLSPSLREQIICRWREFRREPSAFFWVLFMPILFMVGLGFAFSKPRPEVYGIGWIPADHASLTGLEAELGADPQLRLRTGTREELETRMKRGDISLIVEAASPENFIYNLDPANPEARRAQAYVDDRLEVRAGRVDRLQKDIRPITAEGGRYVDFLIPGLLGLSIMSSSLFGVAMTIVSNRKENVLKRYLATPMRAAEYIISHLAGRMIVLAFEFTAVMIAGFLIFRFHVYGNWLSYLLLAVLGAGAFTSLAMLCAARTRSIPMISGLTNLLSLSMMMLSGVFFSRNVFPTWLQELTRFLPLTALNDGLRRVALEGLGFRELGPELLVLAFYLVVPALLTRKLFRWY